MFVGVTDGVMEIVVEGIVVDCDLVVEYEGDTLCTSIVGLLNVGKRVGRGTVKGGTTGLSELDGMMLMATEGACCVGSDEEKIVGATLIVRGDTLGKTLVGNMFRAIVGAIEGPGEESVDEGSKEGSIEGSAESVLDGSNVGPIVGSITWLLGELGELLIGYEVETSGDRVRYTLGK